MRYVKAALVTGAGGLVGSSAVQLLSDSGWHVVGIDNDMRAYFFGSEASTTPVVELLQQTYTEFELARCDIRDRDAILQLFRSRRFDLIIHAAAQPSHDWAAREPHTDFSVNADGTLVLLEAFRNHCPEAVFIFVSTNKVYGDNPNRLPLVEGETRWEISPGHRYEHGIDETMSVDGCLHSLFGASKLAADILVQEYGRYFGLSTGVFRAGCITGSAHRGVELHGFLNYLVKAVVLGRPYRVYGYLGKQVRDNIHALDLVRAFITFYENPRPGAVYNIGGTRYSHCSLLEAVRAIEGLVSRRAILEYVDKPRIGDHIWYVTDMRKFRADYPGWEFTYTLERILEELARSMVDFVARR